MAYRVELTRRAARDLRRLYVRIRADDSSQAKLWFNALEGAIDSLDISPGRCPTTPEHRDLRHLLFGSKPHVYRVIFKVEEDKSRVIVLHVRHGAMKPLD